MEFVGMFHIIYFSVIIILCIVFVMIFFKQNKKNEELSVEKKNIQDSHKEELNELRNKLLQEKDEMRSLYEKDINNYRTKEIELISEKEKLSEKVKNYLTVNDDYKLLQEKYLEINKEYVAMETENKKNEEIYKKNIHFIEESKKQLLTDFENLSNKIFDEKSKRFKETNKESIESIIDPVKENLNDFKKRINDLYGEEAKDKASLKTEIKNLMDINKRLNEDALNLTKALTHDSKTQGNWGEMELKRILEISGLKKDITYELQARYKDEENNTKIPDAIIKLPNDKVIVIDAKNSLTNFKNFVSATDKSEKERELKAHLSSVKNHINELSPKRYEQFVDKKSINYVLMFIPSESAYQVALENDNQLYVDAIEKQIILVGPTTLIFVCKMIEQMWRSEDQKNNIQDIIKKGTSLYNKLCIFEEKYVKVSSAIETLSKSYDDSMITFSKGKGNLVKQANEFKELGLKPKKNLISKSDDELEIVE